MKKVKMLTSMVGLDVSYAYGDVVEVSDEVAEAWEKAEIAEIVVEAPVKKTQRKKVDA